MRKTFTLFTFLFTLFFLINATAQEIFEPTYHVIPAAYASAPGTGVFTGPLGTTARTYQLLMHESLLTDLVGKEISAFQFRLPPAASAPWPSADITFNSYDIYLSGSVPPANRSLTFADNVVGTQTLVRSGSLTIRAGLYPSGSSPNDFGDRITFDTLWLYTGGHLLFELRHTGFTGATSSSIDALTTSTPGYLVDFSGLWQGNYTAVTGLGGNFGIIRFTADDPVPVELTSFSAFGSGNNVVLNWVTATETNNYGFEIERSTSSTWQNIGFISGAGTTTEENSYSFTDRNLVNGIYSYRLKQIDFDGTVSYSDIVEIELGLPGAYSLDQNYPNPFNPSTTIRFALKEKSLVRLAVFNSIGEETAVLLNEEKDAGDHEINFNAHKLMSGVYFYELRAGDFVKTKKMLLIK
jgi:hypothetical protein